MKHNNKKQPIPFISPAHLSDINYLENQVYLNTDINYYWSDCWELSFYRRLACAGFISVAMDHDQLGPLLIPEIQSAYAVLDWKNLHVPRKIKKNIKVRSLNEKGIVLSFSHDPGAVLEAIQAHFGSECWLTSSYTELIYGLQKESRENDLFHFHTIELREKGILVAGELGYTCGSVYTSLTGFSSRKKEYNNRGKIQMILLAGELEKRGYAFWNLGHPYMDYKIDLGCKVLTRERFLQKWKKSSSVELI